MLQQQNHSHEGNNISQSCDVYLSGAQRSSAGTSRLSTSTYRQSVGISTSNIMATRATGRNNSHTKVRTLARLIMCPMDRGNATVVYGCLVVISIYQIVDMIYGKSILTRKELNT
eukprot:SAG31_NODE_4042_length_3642_cov_2.065481_3_plen_115_part_00